MPCATVVVGSSATVVVDAGKPRAVSSSSHVDPGALDALLVRVGAHGDDWVEHLPPVPAGCTVSVSFDSWQLQQHAAAALDELGYVTAGVAPTGTPDQPGAFFLVPWSSVSERGMWWRTLTAVADRVYDPAFGPVRAMLRDILELHAATRG